MKRLMTWLAILAITRFAAGGSTTIDAVSSNSWGANIGWVNWRGDVTNGAIIGEYVCFGYIYGANVGWISLGNGNPANHIQYQNNSATDFGVNFTIDPAQPGYAILRGYAYSANVGWINFESMGNARAWLATGALSGYAYSANCGWVNLNDLTGDYVKTNSIAPGADTDGNGLADAWEYIYFGHLGVDPNVDFDGTGQTNLFKYIAGLNPIDPTSRFTIDVQPVNGEPNQKAVVFTPTVSGRTYAVQYSTSLSSWQPLTGGTQSDNGNIRTIIDPNATGVKKFYRVQVTK